MIPEILRALVLGIVQGLTEFLPISSSGHLEIINHLFGSNNGLGSDLTMAILVHFGTALSIVYVFRNRIFEIIKGIFSNNPGSRDFALKVVLSCLPAVVVGIGFESQIENLFEGSIVWVGLFLIITGVILFFTPHGRLNQSELTHSKSFVIGVAQAIAILPGISRSGSTIATALSLGISRKAAAEFSFLMVLPIIFGKIILDVGSGELIRANTSLIPLVVALASSFFVGVLACRWMINIVQRSQLRHFAYYCWAIGLFSIFMAVYAG